MSERQQRKLDALALKAPDLLAEVQAGTMSTDAACIKAGISKKLPPLVLLRKAWARASDQERAAFLAKTSPAR